MVKTAADYANVEFAMLGTHDGDQYHFVSTHGFPFSASLENVSAPNFKNIFYGAALEISDLHEHPRFRPTVSVPIARTWRYAANMPVRLDRPLADGGGFSLSVADRTVRETGGSTRSTLIELSRIAVHISDVVWLALQLHISTISSEKSALASRMIMDGVSQTFAPIGLVDQDLKLLEFSPGLASFQKKLVGKPPQVGQSLFEHWIDQEGEAAVRAAMQSDKPVMNASSYLIDQDRPVIYDFQSLSFPEADLKLGVFSVSRNTFDYHKNVVKQPRARSAIIPNRTNNLENANVVGDLLFETLREHKRLRQRKGHSYIALRSWRKPIKTYQLAALKSLKRHGSDTLSERIAIELRTAIEAVHGKIEDGIVVPVPCGHSGPGCLSEKLAEALAALMGLRVVFAFETLAVKGSSHPRANPTRPRMKLREAPTGRVILVDDVATSGSHIEEARSLLARSATAVWPIVWIAE